MGLFDFMDELLDSAEDVIKETPKTVAEKAPELASFLGKTALTAGHKAVELAGRKMADFQSEKFLSMLRTPSIDPDKRREALARYIRQKTNAVNGAISSLNTRLENPSLSNNARQSIEQEIRRFEHDLAKIEREEKHLSAEIERYS